MLVGWVQKLRNVEETSLTFILWSNSSPWEVAMVGVAPS